MESGFKKGAMVMLLRASNPFAQRWVGTPQTLERIAYVENGITRWVMNPPLICADGVEMYWEQPDMIVIDDKPGDDETLTWVGKPAPATRQLTEAEFDAACDRWVMGVES